MTNVFIETPKYSELVLALRKDPKQILASLTDIKADAWHMVTGIAGEAFELLENYPEGADPENVIEELGDLCFYLVGLWICTGAKPVVAWTDPAQMTRSELYLQIAYWSGKILDVVKKWIVYEKDYKEIQPQLQQYTRELAGVIECMGRDFGFSPKFVLRYNMAKLTERYGEKYSDAAAKARADKVGE